MEFGYFYNAIGTKVTLVEILDRNLLEVGDDVVARLTDACASAAPKTWSETSRTVQPVQSVGIEIGLHRGVPRRAQDHRAARRRGRQPRDVVRGLTGQDAGQGRRERRRIRHLVDRDRKSVV